MSPSPTTPRQPPRLPSADVHASPPRRSSPARDSASAVVRTAVPSPVSRFEDTVRRGCKTSLQAYNKISNEYSKAHNDANIDDILSLDVLTLLRALQAEVAQPQSEAAKLKARLARRWKTSVAEIDATFSATTSQHFLKHVCAIAQLIDLRTALPLLQQERDQRQSGSASHRGLKRTRDWTPQDADRVLKRLREEKDTAVDDGDENSEREIEGVRRAQDPLPDDLDELSDDDFFAPESLSPSPSPSPSASPYIFAPPESKLLQNHARKRRHLSPITEEPTPLPTRSPHSSQFLQSPLSFENHHSTAEPPLATPGLTQSSQDSDIPDNKSPPIPVASAPPDRPMASAVEEDGSVHAVDADGPAVLSDDEVPTLDIDRPAVLSDDDRAHALASLRPKTKLNSVAVNHALEFVVASQQEWAWIDSMHPAGLSDELAREQNATSFVHAVHLAPSHWALAVVNSLTKDLFILNSYRSLSQAVIQQVEATVADKLDVSERLCPQQPNDYDCGVYTVAFAFYAVAARPLPGTIASRFWRRCLEVLVSGNAPAEDDGDYGTVSIPTLTIGDSGSFCNVIPFSPSAAFAYSRRSESLYKREWATHCSLSLE
ncbi:hypothetical protein DBV05_g8601 [Lasiodiplodia theobromae]|uniref:Ubiquitin-like protease family profile domain-containing protein n=1 Tax=Lasiodiplodia theobromae TaxID=45133 RepID=A0A5N5D4V6_9PEZI|nr:hypothetical protein DBV05_g8601 [Lasiodiplodia theobromae]